MSRQARLGLDDPSRPVPVRPTFIHALGGQALVETFDDLAGLARRVLQLADPAPGLKLSDRAWPCACSGFEPFMAWSVYAIGVDESQSWLGSCAGLDLDRARLEAAIKAAQAARTARAFA